MLIVLILGMVFTYVWQINNQAEQSFIIKELEENQTELEDIIHDKQLTLSTARSLATIAQRAKDLELENPKDIVFLKIGLSTVAVKEDMAEFAP